MFPNARLLISDRRSDRSCTLSPTDSFGTAIQTLIDGGLVDTFSNADKLASGATAEWTGLHNFGYFALHVGHAETTATFVVQPRSDFSALRD